MKENEFHEMQKDLDRIRRMEASPRLRVAPFPAAALRRRWLEWALGVGRRLGGFARRVFDRRSREAVLEPSETLVRLIQVINEEPRIYHLFMYLATSPADVRTRYLDQMSERIQGEGGDADIANLIHELRDPRVFEAAYRTIQQSRK